MQSWPASILIWLAGQPGGRGHAGGRRGCAHQCREGGNDEAVDDEGADEQRAYRVGRPTL